MTFLEVAVNPRICKLKIEALQVHRIQQHPGTQGNQSLDQKALVEAHQALPVLIPLHPHNTTSLKAGK